VIVRGGEARGQLRHRGRAALVECCPQRDSRRAPGPLAEPRDLVHCQGAVGLQSRDKESCLGSLVRVTLPALGTAHEPLTGPNDQQRAVTGAVGFLGISRGLLRMSEC
jgi:hypothetical protein